MARTAGNGTHLWLGLLIGALVVAIAVIGYVVYTGRQMAADPPRSIDVDIDVRPPPIPDAPRIPDAPIPTPK